MFHKISRKLIATFLSVAVITAAVIYISAYFAIYRGLDNVANATHLNHLNELARRLSSVYQTKGGWENILEDELWLKSIFPAANDVELRKELWKTPTDNEFPLYPDVRLLDANGNVLSEGLFNGAGYPMVPILVNGDTVGSLGFPVGPHLRRQIQIAFDQESKVVFFLSLAAALLSASLTAWWLSRGFLKPIHHISRQVHGLAAGEFNHPVNIKSHDELGTLAQDINFLASALEQSQEARKRWISDIAHELRTPLTVLSAEVESAQYGIQGSSDDMLKSMEEEIGQLNNLISDLRTLAQTDIGELSFHREHINVATCFGENLERARAVLQRAELSLETRIEIDSKVQMFVDRSRMLQLLGNLLQNSCRYTDAGGKVRVTVCREADSVLMVWEDSAPGVSDENLPRLFDRLYRVEESRNRVSGGSGLGLAICRNIVVGQQGSIEAKQSELGGLAVYCRLPLLLG